MKEIMFFMITAFIMGKNFSIWKPPLIIGSKFKKNIGIDYEKSNLEYDTVLTSTRKKDSNTGNSFGIYWLVQDNNFFYTKIDDTRDSYFGKIMSFLTTPEIFVAQGFARNNSGGGCNESDTTGCLDLLFYSVKNRTNFAKLPIKRPKGTADTYHRVCPSFVYISQTYGSPYIFYLRYKQFSPGASIVYSTKSPAFKKFSSEKILFPNRVVNYGLTSYLTAKDGNFRIHLAWFENKYDLMISSTSDGINWAEPKKIQEGVDVSSLYSYTSFLKLNKLGTTLILLYYGKDKSGQITISENEGHTWSEPYQTTEPESDSLSGCKYDNKIYVASLRYQKPKISVFDIRTKHISTLESPFSDISDLYQIKIRCKKLFGVGIISVVGFISSKKRIMITRNVIML